MKEGEVETSRHFLLHCSAFERFRMKYTAEPGDIDATDISRPNKLVIDSKRLVDL